MNNYIYIFTDSNRSCLHVGMTDDLQRAAKTYRELKGLFFDAHPRVSRLVYHETLPGSSEALRRFNELSRYTRMQKKRLMRRRNPNWPKAADLPSTKRITRHYQPGAKLSPKVPNRTSDRWNGKA